MKHLYLILTLFSINSYTQGEFITIWKSDITLPYNSITIPITQNTSVINYQWQSLNQNLEPISEYSSIHTAQINNDPRNNSPLTITFTAPGIYRVKIQTNSSEFKFQNFQNQYGKELIRIEQWGDINWSTFENSFSNCINLDITATDYPNLNNVTSMHNMFGNCEKLVFNETISNWNVENIIDFSYMFYNALLFNQNINKWNTANATNLNYMFQSANSFNQPIGNWNVNNVTHFSGMFHFNKVFNQNLNQWQTNSAQDLSHMFCGTKKFNQNINHFNVSNVTNFQAIFDNSISFDQDISSWELNSILPSGAYSFFDYSGMSCENFRNTITAWSENINLNSNINIGIDQMKYTEELSPVLRWLETNKNWSFAGEMIQFENCTLLNENFTKQNIKIYPNPTTDIIYIEGIEVKKIEIYDTKGTLFYSDTNKNKIQINNLSTGIYTLIINNKYEHQIIKK